MRYKSMVFVVDDNADYRFLVKWVFSQFQYQYPVHYFESGDTLYTFMVEKAPQLAHQPESSLLPGLIILDLHMAGKNGLDVLALIRQHPHWHQIPVVMMSNTKSPEDISACYTAGANSFIEKPTNANQLQQVLETTCHYWLGINRLP